MRKTLKTVGRVFAGAYTVIYSVFILIHLLFIRQSGSVVIYENSIRFLNFEIVFMTVVSILFTIYTYFEYKEALIVQGN